MGDGEKVLKDIVHHAFELPFEDPASVEFGERFSVLTAFGNEWTDGWWFVLVESGPSVGDDRLIYQDPEGRIHEHWLLPGVYDRVVREFLAWFTEHSSYRSDLQ